MAFKMRVAPYGKSPLKGRIEDLPVLPGGGPKMKSPIQHTLDADHLREMEHDKDGNHLGAYDREGGAERISDATRRANEAREKEMETRGRGTAKKAE